MSKKHVTLTQFKLFGQRVAAFIVLLSNSKQDKISGHMVGTSDKVVVTDSSGAISYRTTEELKGDLGAASAADIQAAVAASESKTETALAGKQPNVSGSSGQIAGFNGSGQLVGMAPATAGVLPLTGGTLTGNLSGKQIQGTLLQTTASSHLDSASEKICVLDASGWIHHRTPAEVVAAAGGSGLKFGSAEIGAQIMAGTFDYDTTI